MLLYIHILKQIFLGVNMYLYRAMTSEELINRLNGISENKPAIKGVNTFKYIDKDYIHFYKYAEHVFFFKKKFDLAVVSKVNIRTEIIPPLEYGFYSDITTYYDDSLYGYPIPLPEIIIDRELFHNNNIVEFSNVNNGNFRKKENGEYEREFWVESKKLFSDSTSQLWTIEGIYYEYIKRLIKKFD
jgi:hypothetical protein